MRTKLRKNEEIGRACRKKSDEKHIFVFMIDMNDCQKHLYVSPLGDLLLAGNGAVLKGVWFEGQKHFPTAAEKWPWAAEHVPFVRHTCKWLDAYFGGEALPLFPLLQPVGTAFERIVWEELLLIPEGKTMSYKAVAERVATRQDKSTAAIRAVAGAIGRNPISLLIPCHRVVGADGTLRGYAGGLWRKAALLALETERVGRME